MTFVVFCYFSVNSNYHFKPGDLLGIVENLVSGCIVLSDKLIPVSLSKVVNLLIGHPKKGLIEQAVRRVAMHLEPGMLHKVSFISVLHNSYCLVTAEQRHPFGYSYCDYILPLLPLERDSQSLF